jgi:malate dehydrogenase (oxaloacetate-decarboxylating)
MDATKLLRAYKKQGARIGTAARARLRSKRDFALWYTPGVGAAAAHLARHREDARAMSVKKNAVAVVSDGSAVLGLGDIGPYGALPVMEGKALIFKELAGIDAWPIVLDVHEPEEIVQAVKAIAPAFGGINLEDIAAPACFEIEKKLIEALDIPVMHDDQHGTAIAVLAGLMNAAKVVKKDLEKLKIIIAGAGAAGTAVASLLHAAGVADLTLVDRGGIIGQHRTGLSPHKQELAALTNPRGLSGGLPEALRGADAFIGLSGKGLLKAAHIRTMAPRAIVFALANPEPEILPAAARRAGAAVVATGRSDFPNQINNALAYPGIFRGALDRGAAAITEAAKLRAARALAALVPRPGAERIVPELLDPRVVKAVAKSVR